jgi:hypothetical protein
MIREEEEGAPHLKNFCPMNFTEACRMVLSTTKHGHAERAGSNRGRTRWAKNRQDMARTSRVRMKLDGMNKLLVVSLWQYSNIGVENLKHGPECLTMMASLPNYWIEGNHDGSSNRNTSNSCNCNSTVEGPSAQLSGESLVIDR